MGYVIFNGDGNEPAGPERHLVHPITDHTLCGLTMDGDMKTAGSFEIKIMGPVTCVQCVKIIKHCRNIKTA